jgi:opacity protein-like surface antigen
MKKLTAGTIALSSVMMVSGAQAFTFNPYVSNKLSFSMVNKTDSKSVTTAHIGDNVQSARIELSNGDDSVFGNRLAVGVAFPIEKIFGTVRTELEWGWNSTASTKEKFTTYDRFLNGDYVSGYMSAAPGEYKNEVGINTFMLNVYYDFDTKTAFTPYVGFGLGMALVNFKTPLYDENDNTMAWSIGAGVAYAINNNISIDFGYRYTDLGKAQLETKFQPDWVISGPLPTKVEHSLAMHDFTLGVRYTF